MSELFREILEANERYAKEFGDKASLPMAPGRRFAILTCMDARIDPPRLAGFKEGDAHVVRNAGGRATDDAIRSLIISYKLLGVREWFVIHHTDCGMETFTNDVMGHLLEGSLETATLDERGWRNANGGPGSVEGRYINWLPIRNQSESVIEDVTRLRHHPLVSPEVVIRGMIFDVRTGRLLVVDRACEIGRSTVVGESEFEAESRMRHQRGETAA